MQDESLRWLIANGRLDEARQVVKNACKWNKKDYATVMAAGGFVDDNLDQETKRLNSDYGDVMNNINGVQKSKNDLEDTELNEGLIKDDVESLNVISIEQEPVKVVVKKYTAIDIFRYPQILRVSLILWFTW